MKMRLEPVAAGKPLAPSDPHDRSSSGHGPRDVLDLEFRPVAQAQDLPPVLEVKQARANTTPFTNALADPVAAEELRLLRARVRALDAERPFRVVGIASAVGDEGKSMISLGLARTLIQEPDARVLLVESDLRRPALERYLGLHRVPGLGEWLETGCGPVSLRRVGPGGFFLIAAGLAADPRPAILLGSRRMALLLESARRSFDYIVLDCPPLLPVADTVVLQELIDGFLLVVRERVTSWATLDRALSRVKPDCIRGVVLNDHEEIIPRDHAYGYGYPYAGGKD